MPVCQKIKSKKRQVCIGDLKDRIDIFDRALVDRNDGNIASLIDFTLLAAVWAKVTTTRGSQLFDGVEISDPFTVTFEIRFLAGLSSENWIVFKNNRYQIRDIQDYDERNEFLLLSCTLKGDDTKEANFA